MGGIQITDTNSKSQRGYHDEDVTVAYGKGVAYEAYFIEQNRKVAQGSGHGSTGAK